MNGDELFAVGFILVIGAGVAGLLTLGFMFIFHLVGLLRDKRREIQRR